MLLGGALAAAIGFAAARYVLPEGWPVRIERAQPAEAAAALAALEARVAGLEGALDARVAGLRQEIAQAPAAGPDMARIAAGIDERVAAALAPLASTLEELAARIAALEARPAPAAGPPAGLSDADLAALRELRGTLEQRRAEIEGWRARLEETVLAAEERIAAASARLDVVAATAEGLQRSMALTRLRADVAAGQPFEAALQILRGAGGEVPDALARYAGQGVESIGSMQHRFPAAARAGLAAALAATGGEDWGARAADFLRAQVGARSLAPRAGDDPDAVLSRAEAALDAGDVAAALAELDALNEAGRAAMANWISDAQAHLAVTAALDSLVAGN